MTRLAEGDGGRRRSLSFLVFLVFFAAMFLSGGPERMATKNTKTTKREVGGRYGSVPLAFSKDDAFG